MNDVPVESNDDEALRFLAGASFGPNAKLILPSGRELPSDEAQAFTSMYSNIRPGRRTGGASESRPRRSRAGAPVRRPGRPFARAVRWLAIIALSATGLLLIELVIITLERVLGM